MSTEYISSLVILIVSVLKIFKIEVLPEEITPIVVGLLGLYLLIKRYARGDLTPLGMRKIKTEQA